MKKSIAHILKGREKFITKEESVLQPLPHKDFRFANPFIVLHHQLPKIIKPGSQLPHSSAPASRFCAGYIYAAGRRLS